ncbi:MAG TPA: choice-of-anchor B family protein [Actinomycetota bacterium]|nr:choice-of-anchor B family protein [Actinomycetota bacterium]
MPARTKAFVLLGLLAALLLGVVPVASGHVAPLGPPAATTVLPDAPDDAVLPPSLPSGSVTVPGAEATEAAPKASEAPAAESGLSPAAQTFECEGGMAGPFPCQNVDLASIFPLGGAGAGTGNDVWGWTDPKTGKEYALVGSALVTTFVDVTDPENPRNVGFLPTSGITDFVLWRDIKVDGNYAFIVAEHTNHGMQVFDLTRLRDAGPVPQLFTADVVYRGADEEGEELGNAHNIAINEETDFAYVIGSNTCVSGPGGQNGGLHMVDISQPENPKFAGCALVMEPANHNYIHDVQCVVYRGPDADYRGHEICFGSNEEVVVVYDVTDKDNPVVISQWGYPQASYTHQGWLTPDQRFFLFGDEGDETSGTVDNTTTYIMDATDLDAPRIPKPFFHETRSIDHNLYIKDNLVHQANYGAGLRILSFSNSSLSKGQLNEVGYFDIRPGFDAPEFVGTWSNYPYFKSGTVVLTGIEEGSTVLYVLQPTGEAAGDAGGGPGGGGNQGGGGGGAGGGGGQGEGPHSGEEGPEETTAPDPGAAGLAVTGAQLVLFVLFGFALIAAGTLMQRMRRPHRAGAEN